MSKDNLTDEELEEIQKQIRYAIWYAIVRGWVRRDRYNPEEWQYDLETGTFTEFFDSINKGCDTGWYGIYRARDRAYYAQSKKGFYYTYEEEEEGAKSVTLPEPYSPYPSLLEHPIIEQLLSSGQVDVLDNIMENLSIKDIAHELGVSERAVYYQREEIIKKLRDYFKK